jgi:hypothetical protein
LPKTNTQNLKRLLIMKDERGLYYYPSSSNHRVRMYVKAHDGVVWFRMWNADDPQLWEQHEWVPYGAILKAAEMYAGKNFDPRRAYDIELAKALIDDNA